MTGHLLCQKGFVGFSNQISFASIMKEPIRGLDFWPLPPLWGHFLPTVGMFLFYLSFSIVARKKWCLGYFSRTLWEVDKLLWCGESLLFAVHETKIEAGTRIIEFWLGCKTGWHLNVYNGGGAEKRHKGISKRQVPSWRRPEVWAMSFLRPTLQIVWTDLEWMVNWKNERIARI